MKVCAQKTECREPCCRRGAPLSGGGRRWAAGGGRWGLGARFQHNSLTPATLQSLREMGCPTEGLRFDRSLVIRGLIMDTELGNLVKADRFGWVLNTPAPCSRSHKHGVWLGWMGMLGQQALPACIHWCGSRP